MPQRFYLVSCWWFDFYFPAQTAANKAMISKIGNKLVSLQPASIRYVVFISALGLLGGFWIINQYFLLRLENYAQEISSKEAKLYAVAISETLNRSELNVLFDEVVQKSQVPIIITDDRLNPTYWKNIRTGFWGKQNQLPEGVAFENLALEQQQILKNHLARFDQNNNPLELISEGHSFGWLHYGDLPLVNQLAWMPLVELVAILLFCFVAYFGLQIIRSNEQSLLWVGLAKETAHQLGTPISSLLGWIEFLRLKLPGTQPGDKNVQILSEMESDISRLNRVATRFSQIGSKPVLKSGSVNELIKNTTDYFQSRLPRLGKKISLDLELREIPKTMFNWELLGWVFENLIRNAVDSIEVNSGLIIISSKYQADREKIRLLFSDNGKGIPKENLKHIFNTGFTTKKRGWGIGLSLAKRIVEEYHGGKIYVQETSRDGGTTFGIELPVSQPGAVKSNL